VSTRMAFNMTRPLEKPGHTALGLWSLSLAYFAMGTSSIAVVGLVNNMAADLGVSKPDIAVLITVFALTFALAAPLLQVAAGSLPRRTLLLCGLVVMASGSLLSALAPTYGGVIAARVLMALGAAAVGPVASGLGAGLVPPERQGHALAVVFGGMTLASVLGLPLTAWLGALLGWRWMFAGLALLSLLTAATIALLVGDRRAAPSTSLASFGQVFRQRAAAWSVAMSVCHMAAQFSLFALVAPFLQERFGVSPWQLSFALLVGGLSGVAGNLLAGRLGDRLGAPRSLLCSVIGMACASSAMLLLPGLPWWGIAAYGFWSMSGMSFYAPQQKRLIGLAPDLRNLLLAINASALYIGMSLGAAAGSRAWLHLGPWSLPAVALGFIGCSLGSFLLSRRAERGPSAALASA
jgi:MFS transporter, DHA1 family, inner membrane transport protein